MDMPTPKRQRPVPRFWEQVTEALASKVYVRLEEANALPLPEQSYDVVIDDPQMYSMHVYLDVVAVSARAAHVLAYANAMRDEDFRIAPPLHKGDERSVEALATEGVYSYVYRSGENPLLDYQAMREERDIVTGIEHPERFVLRDVLSSWGADVKATS